MTTTLAENVTTNEQLPAVQCAHWCEDGTGHAGATSPEDQWCHGARERITLTREPLHTYKGETWLDVIEVILERDYDGRSPFVQMVRNETSGGPKLSLGEARELGEALIRLADTGTA